MCNYNSTHDGTLVMIICEGLLAMASGNSYHNA